MPKMKTHSGSKKRFRRTANGLVKRSAAFRRHHAWAWSSDERLGKRGTKYASKPDMKRLQILLPD